MSDDGAAVEKKGRGRPKSDESKKAEKRAKPAVEKSVTKKEDGEAPAKRGRGRPKKGSSPAKSKVKYVDTYSA